MNMASDIVNMIVQGILAVYNWLVEFLRNLFLSTVFRDRPDLADKFSSALTILISLTAIYLLLVFVSAIKRIIGILLLIGWVLLIIAIIGAVL